MYSEASITIDTLADIPIALELIKGVEEYRGAIEMRLPEKQQFKISQRMRFDDPTSVQLVTITHKKADIVYKHSSWISRWQCDALDMARGEVDERIDDGMYVYDTADEDHVYNALMRFFGLPITLPLPQGVGLNAYEGYVYPNMVY